MKSLVGIIISTSLVVAGCTNSDVTNGAAAVKNSVDAKYVATHEPADALSVSEARASIKDGQHVSLVGIIGGSSDPFVDGLAAFTIVDTEVAYCQPEEGCPTPWDYCCTQDQVKQNIAMVKVVDEAGGLVSSDARKLLGVQELATVVASGIAKVDPQGNLSIAASKVFVKPGE